MALRDLARPPLLCVVSMVLVLPYALILRGFGLVSTSADTMAIAAVLVAAMLGSIVGFGFAPLCAAMLLPLMGDPVQVVTILLLGSIAIQSLSVWTLRRSIDWHALLPFLAGGVLGLPIGVCLLLHLHRDDYVRLLGGLLVLYGAYMLFRRPVTVRSRPVHDAIVGAAGGVMGGLAAFPSAFVAIWCGMKGWDKTHQRGVYQPFILIMQVLALPILQHVAPGSSGWGSPLWHGRSSPRPY
ncbi:TSUP family transporter [Siccirubricoccus deserti]